MMSVVKLGDPVLAVHPVLITLCDVMWILGLAGEGFLECGLWGDRWKNGVKNIYPIASMYGIFTSTFTIFFH